MKNKLFCALIFTCLGATAPAAPLEFDFKDPKGVNNVVFKTDALLESINGVATGISGRVTFDGQDWTNVAPQQRPLGYVFQDYALFPHLDVESNIAFRNLAGVLWVPGVSRSMPMAPKISAT